MSLEGVYEVEYRLVYAGATTEARRRIVARDAEHAIDRARALRPKGSRWIGALSVRPLAVAD